MFDKIKESWLKRIERNAIKSVLTHANKKGLKLMKKKGLTLEELPNDAKETELVYFKRSLLPLGDWARIYPPVSEDGKKIKWFNLIFGGWRNFVRLILILIIVGFIYLQFLEDFLLIERLSELASTCNATLVK